VIGISGTGVGGTKSREGAKKCWPPYGKMLSAKCLNHMFAVLYLIEI